MSGTEFNDRLDYFLGSGFEAVSSGNLDEALNQFQLAEKLDPENALVLYNLAIVHTRKLDYKNSLDKLDTIRRLELTFVDNLACERLYAYNLIKLELFNEALDRIAQSSLVYPNDIPLLSMKGYALEKITLYKSAITVYEYIITLDKENQNAKNSLAMVLALEGKNIPRAVQLSGQLLKSSPNNAAYLDTAGYVKIQENKFAEAKSLLEKAFELSPDSQEIREHLIFLRSRMKAN